MATSGGQPGNQNARKAKRWENALIRALARAAEGANPVEAGLDKVADQVVTAAIKGDKDAWQEVANRLDGKPAQSTDLNVDAGEGLLNVLAGMARK